MEREAVYSISSGTMALFPDITLGYINGVWYIGGTLSKEEVIELAGGVLNLLETVHHSEYAKCNKCLHNISINPNHIICDLH